MKKVITYGTFDLLHHGHIRLLQRAKALGDYLVVGVTADSFDLARGKINVQQPLMERIEAVRHTGLADKIVIEEYEGQKIDDIRRYDIDIFTVGSDWAGRFDYLKEYCDVVYLERTEGVSSSDIRAEQTPLRLGLVGESPILNKIERESHFVNGLTISGVCTHCDLFLSDTLKNSVCKTTELDKLLDTSDAIFLLSNPRNHYQDIKQTLNRGKHVLCESPIAIDTSHLAELRQLAGKRKLILMDSLKTAYSTAFCRLVLLAKSGAIGNVVSVDATCTSLHNFELTSDKHLAHVWNSICAWGPTAMLPIFQLLGIDYTQKAIVTHLLKPGTDIDTFTKISFVYPNAVASCKVGQGVKSEGELIVSGTKGYIYVPAPWWKTDYFEVRYEDPKDNKRYFYQLDGEGIRYGLVSFLRSINRERNLSYVSDDTSRKIVEVIQSFYEQQDTFFI